MGCIVECTNLVSKAYRTTWNTRTRCKRLLIQGIGGLRSGCSQTDNKKGAVTTTPSFRATRLAASRNQNFRPFRVGPIGWIAQ